MNDHAIRPKSLLESDNLIGMKRMSATDAARGFSDLLDQVEATGEPVVIERRGRVVAMVGPAPAVTWDAVLRALPENGVDSDWAGELRELRRWVGPAPDRWAE